MMSSTRKLLNAIKQPSMTAYVFYRATLTYLLEKPLHALAYALYYAPGVSMAAAQPLTAFTYPNCGIDLVDASYLTISNVKSFAEAEFIFFGEDHLSLSHHENKTQLIEYNGHQSDYLFFEGLDFNSSFPCEVFCVDKDLNAHISADRSACLPTINFASKFQCRGWENEKFMSYINQSKDLLANLKIARENIPVLYNQHVEIYTAASKFEDAEKTNDIEMWSNAMLQVLEKIKITYEISIPDKWSQQKKQLNQLSTEIQEALVYYHAGNLQQDSEFLKTGYGRFRKLIKQVETDINTLNRKYQKFSNDYDAYMASSIIVSDRNSEGLINAITVMKQFPNRKFFMAGMGHFLKRSIHDSCFFKLDKKSLLPDVLESVKDKKYAFVIFKP
jgi:hypothetical protein